MKVVRTFLFDNAYDLFTFFWIESMWHHTQFPIKPALSLANTETGISILFFPKLNINLIMESTPTIKQSLRKRHKILATKGDLKRNE